MNRAHDPASAARRGVRPSAVALLLAATLALAGHGAAQPDDAALPLHDFADGAEVGTDAVGNPIGFPTWQDGASTLELSVEEVAQGGELALPGQTGTVTVLRVRHRIGSWGGFTHAFADASLGQWRPRDLSRYAGIRFWYKGDGRGGSVQFDLFDNRNPDLPGDSAERYAYRFVDGTTEWRRVEVPFRELARRTDFQPGGAPDDGLTLTETWGWALGFPPGDGVSYVYGVEAYGAAGEAAADAPTVEFASPVARVVEGGEVVVRVVLSEASDDAVSVRAFVQGDTAREMRDLVARSEFLVFPPGETEASFVVPALGDGKYEGEERGVLTLGSPRGAELGFLRRAILVLEDDDTAVPGMIENFEAGVGAMTSDRADLRVDEILSTTAAARPGQDRFEHVLVADGGDAPFRLRIGLSERPDWSEGAALSFWYQGRGDGADVTVRVLDDVAGDAPWETVFVDGFDAPAGAPPDWGVWTAEIGDGTAAGIPGWGNGELQAYTDRPENVAHDGEGRLTITARASEGDAPTCYYGGPCAYTSARLVSKEAIEFTYGRVEARLRLPEGQGLWPAFWLLGANIDEVPWPASGEIDVVENVGREPSTVHGTVHGPGYSGGDGIGRPFTLPDGARFADAFHLFAVEWEPGAIRWYVDDELYSTVTQDDLPRNAEWVFDHPFFLILNVAVGGHWPGAPDASTRFPQAMHVDEVRVLQRADVAERFEATFVDDVAGWRRVELPFDAFVRAVGQPDGAPDDGMSLRRVAGLSIEVGAGAPVRLDEVRVVGD